MSEPLHLYEFVRLEQYVVMFDLRILKSYLNQSNGNSDNSSHKHTCNWFQLEQWKEVLTLLIPLVTNAFLIDQKTEKTHPSKILSGPTVKLAVCIRDSHHSPRIVLLPRAVDGHLTTNGGEFEAATLCRFKVVVSVCSLTDNGSQRDIGHLLKALMEPVSQTSQNTVKISHYFNKNTKQSSSTPDDTSGDSSEQNRTTVIPKEKAILRKIVCENRERQCLKNKLRRRKALAKEEDENVDQNAEGCFLPDIKTEKPDVIELNGGTFHVQRVKELSDQQIKDFFEENRSYLLDIYNSKVGCKRHQDYYLSGAKRRDLDYQVINLSLYNPTQIDCAVDLLKSLFPKKQLEMLDYVLKVLLPEFLIKIYMDIKGLTHDEAEWKMAPTNWDEHNSNQVSEPE